MLYPAIVTVFWNRIFPTDIFTQNVTKLYNKSFGNKTLQPRPITAGVLQENVLGPIVRLLFNNLTYPVRLTQCWEHLRMTQLSLPATKTPNSHQIT